MIRMFARRLHFGVQSAATDEVFFGLSLPSGSRVNGVNIDLQFWASGVRLASEASLYAIEGWILPIHDPDAAATYDQFWDRMVPKDTDVETIDLDTASGDAAPFYEPGEPNFAGLFDVGWQPERIYRREGILSPVTGNIMVTRDPATPFLTEWFPGVQVNIRVNKNYAISQPSVLLFALALPALDDTTNTVSSVALENEWPQTKYIGDVLKRAMLHLFGLVEAGAETPWEEATALLKKHLEPDPFEFSAAKLVSISMNVLAKGICDHSVVGTMEHTQITTA